MDRDTALAQLRVDTARIVELCVPENLDKKVPDCPGWTFEGLAEHITMVWNWAGTIVAERLSAPPSDDLLPERGPAPIRDWARSRSTRLLTELENVPAEADIWTFFPATAAPGAFWWRRQLHETLIHRVDAERATRSELTPVPVRIAADNVSEILEILQFGVEGEKPGEAPAEGMTIHLHSTDVDDDLTPSEWFLDTGTKKMTHAHEKADAAVRGPAFGIACWLWGRSGPEVEVLGDAEGAREWRRSIGM
jgi:uncharacterized protein (TIGR03083 family)